MFGMMPRALTLPPEMIGRFTTSLEPILTRISAGTAPQPIAYHYTDGRGFAGIVENGKIWATHVGYTNDFAEYYEAALTLRREAERRIAAGNISDPARRALSRITTNTTRPDVSAMYPWFVSCFSLAVDDLAQWRGYSGSDSKFAIGFELNHLGATARAIAESQDPNGNREYHCFIAPAIYQSEIKTRIAHEILQFIVDQYPLDEHALAPQNVEAFTQQWMQCYLSIASLFAPTIKNDTFSQEREWRLIVMPMHASSVKYRSRGGLLVPYLELNLKAAHFTGADGVEWPHPFREIWTGPSRHEELNRFSAKCIAEKHGLSNVKIQPSRIPFRDL